MTRMYSSQDDTCSCRLNSKTLPEICRLAAKAQSAPTLTHEPSVDTSSPFSRPWFQDVAYVVSWCMSCSCRNMMYVSLVWLADWLLNSESKLLYKPVSVPRPVGAKVRTEWRNELMNEWMSVCLCTMCIITCSCTRQRWCKCHPKLHKASYSLVVAVVVG